MQWAEHIFSRRGRVVRANWTESIFNMIFEFSADFTCYLTYSYLNSAPFLPVIWYTISLMPKSWFGAPLAHCRCAKQDFLTFLYLVYWDNQFITMVQVSKQLFKVAYVVSGMLFRTLRARRARSKKNSIDPSFLRQDGSNELSHAQFQPTGSKTYRVLHLLLYR